jgi:phosphoserine phosphatase
VDLDGTLIAGDSLRVSLRLVARRQPWRLLAAAFAVLGGRATFKRYVASCAIPEATSLPWRASVVEFLRSEHARGRRLILATAADHRVAARVAAHLQVFDAVISTEGPENRRGAAKLAAIRNLLGDREFDYIGDSFVDFPILLAARKAYLVAPSPGLFRRLTRLRQVERVFEA